MCVFAGMWCLAWETQQGFCSVALQSDGGGSEGGQAVITNSIHFRNNNTALRVNRGLFSSGSHWSARAKNSTHLLSLAVTSQDGALARPPTGWLIFSFALCTHGHSCPCTCTHTQKVSEPVFSRWTYTWKKLHLHILSCMSSFGEFFTCISSVLYS